MAKRSRRQAPPALTPAQMAFPGGIALLGIIVAIVGYVGVGSGLMVASIGAMLYTVGKHWRWKGAPEAAYIFAGVGLLIIIMALTR
ncbi:hypothetical protein BH23BAC4_BH23BAC4_07780 [soil metagenome]